MTMTAAPPEGDPLRDLSAGQPVGLIAIEFATRRRLRVNGTLVQAGHRVVVPDFSGDCIAIVSPFWRGVRTDRDEGENRQESVAKPATYLIKGRIRAKIGTGWKMRKNERARPDQSGDLRP